MERGVNMYLRHACDHVRGAAAQRLHVLHELLLVLARQVLEGNAALVGAASERQETPTG